MEELSLCQIPPCVSNLFEKIFSNALAVSYESFYMNMLIWELIGTFPRSLLYSPPLYPKHQSVCTALQFYALIS